MTGPRVSNVTSAMPSAPSAAPRRTARELLRAALVLAAVVASLGCEDEFTERTDGTTSGALPSGSGGGGSTSGAGGGGGGGGAGPVDLHHEVTVSDDYGQPFEGLPLVVNDVDGKVVSTTVTASDGKAVVEVPLDGSLAAFSDDGIEMAIQAVYRPPPGAPVVLQVHRALPRGMEPTTYTFFVDDYPPSTATVGVVASCMNSSVPVGEPLEVSNELCAYLEAPAFLFLARDAAHTVIGWTVRDDIGTSPGLHLTLGVTATSTDTAASHLSTVAAPASATLGSASLAVSAGLASFQDGGGAPFDGRGAFTKDAVVPAIPGAVYLTTQATHFSAPPSNELVFRYESGDTAPGDPELDASQAMRVTTEPVDATDPLHPVLSCQVSGEGELDSVTFSSNWASGDRFVRYDVLVPPDGRSTRLPDIPDDLAQFRPTDAASSVFCRFTGSDSVDGYAEAVQTPPYPPPPGVTYATDASYQP